MKTSKKTCPILLKRMPTNLIKTTLIKRSCRHVNGDLEALIYKVINTVI